MTAAPDRIARLRAAIGDLTLADVLAEKQYRARNRILKYYPDEGPLRRELYPKHLQFFAAGGIHEPMPSCPATCDGSPHRERCAMMGNRCGKTEAGTYETTLHLTGDYPAWWTGKRFGKPVKVWAAGDTARTVREILQDKFLGPIANPGVGMIPYDRIIHRTMRQGVPEAIDTIYVRHNSGGSSSLTFKSYDQRREAFQGSTVDFVFLDEECDMGIYSEALMRTMTCDGQVILCFTPLLGLSEVVLNFLPNGPSAM